MDPAKPKGTKIFQFQYFPSRGGKRKVRSFKQKLHKEMNIARNDGVDFKQ